MIHPTNKLLPPDSIHWTSAVWELEKSNLTKPDRFLVFSRKDCFWIDWSRKKYHKYLDKNHKDKKFKDNH